MKLRFYSLWSINAELNERRLCEQLTEMRRYGFDGAVFHPRFYPNTPPYLGDEYLSILSKVILHAKSIGMEFWLYDENGWPSGTVGGELLIEHPEVRQQWLELSETQSPQSLGQFDHQGRKWFANVQLGAGVDYLNPELAKHFLAMTHERYRHGLDPAAFEYVSAFFCDEPEFGLGHAFDLLSPLGAIPWTPRLVELYRKRYRQDLIAQLPLLFFERDGYQQARVQFWELLTDVFCDAFIDPMDRWCREQGKRFTAHFKGEEHPLFQVPMFGSGHQTFQHLALPGIDALERYPSGHFFPRQVASAARQFGNADCMVECFGGAGWGATPEDLQNYLIWLADHGLNHFVLHLNQYQLSTHAIHDWPASIPAHVNWRDVFPEIIQRVRQHSKSDQTPADTLVVAPFRGIMEEYNPRELLQTNIHNAATYPPTKAGQLNTHFLNLLETVHQSGMPYHLIDERSLEQHGAIVGKHLQVGHCRYHRVIAADGIRVNERTHNLIRQFYAPVDLPALVVPPPIAEMTDCEIHWAPPVCDRNLLVLEATTGGASDFVAHFQAALELPIQIVFAQDHIFDVILNGIAVDQSSITNCTPRRNEIRFKSHRPTPTPFVFIRGRFAVRSQTPYFPGPNATVQTEGPFLIDRPCDTWNSDLTTSGFPFCAELIVITGWFETTSQFSRIKLTAIHADAARISVDGANANWCWAPDWTIAAPMPIGRHQIEVRLVPSSFNRFGPHHHIDGDLSVVSPSQYEYVRNFADRPDAPPCTKAKAWHFKPVAIGSHLLLR